MSPQSGNEAIPVIDVHNEQVTQRPDLLGQTRRLLLAGLGAVALTVDEANSMIDRLADRGEVVQKDRTEKIQKLRSRLRAKRKAVLDAEDARAKVAQAVQVAEEGVEELIHAFNIPTKRDVEKLHQELDLLHQKLDRLSQQN